MTVADTVRCELEIERESETEVTVEIEFSWTEPARVKVANEGEPSKDDEAAQATEATPEAAS
ncbi:hypothetical protein JNW90_19320 [Micromonospora sp. STR1s_5]|nr:hypothetical protein [Micromonospora sp. STR1s_5]